jgi:hypothetical protein
MYYTKLTWLYIGLFVMARLFCKTCQLQSVCRASKTYFFVTSTSLWRGFPVLNSSGLREHRASHVCGRMLLAPLSAQASPRNLFDSLLVEARAPRGEMKIIIQFGKPSTRPGRNGTDNSSDVILYTHRQEMAS